MALLDDLEQKVSSQKSVIGSVKTLLTDLSAKIVAAGNDPARLQALVAEINAHNEELAAAVVANTPAEE